MLMGIPSRVFHSSKPLSETQQDLLNDHFVLASHQDAALILTSNVESAADKLGTLMLA